MLEVASFMYRRETRKQIVKIELNWILSVGEGQVEFARLDLLVERLVFEYLRMYLEVI